MNTNHKTQRMSIYFPLDLLEAVRKSAKENRRSFNGEVLWILQHYVSDRKEKP